MELQDLINARHSVRKFTESDIPDEDILKIIDAARVGPTPENAQNMHFLVIRDKGFKEKLGELILKRNEELVSRIAEVDEKRSKRFDKFTRLFILFAIKAPVLIMIYSYSVPPAAYVEYGMIGEPEEKIKELFLQNCGMQGLGACLEHSVLKAIELGYGSCLMTGQNWLHEDIEDLVKQELGFSRDGWFLATMLPVGVPEGKAKSPGRNELSDMIQFF